MQKIKFHSSYTCIDGPMAKPGSGNTDSVMAVFYFENDLGFLFPYIKLGVNHRTQAVVWAARHQLI
jgi:hypothetical protein